MLFPAGSGLAVRAQGPSGAGEAPAHSCSSTQGGFGSSGPSLPWDKGTGGTGSPKPGLSSLFLPQPEGFCSQQSKIEHFLSSVDREN